MQFSRSCKPGPSLAAWHTMHSGISANTECHLCLHTCAHPHDHQPPAHMRSLQPDILCHPHLQTQTPSPHRHTHNHHTPTHHRGEAHDDGRLDARGTQEVGARQVAHIVCDLRVTARQEHEHNRMHTRTAV